MNELIGDEVAKRNYLTQDEMGVDSRLGKFTGAKRQRKRKPKHESADEDDLNFRRVANTNQFTPGRIRPSRVANDQNTLNEYNGRRDNYI